MTTISKTNVKGRYDDLKTQIEGLRKEMTRVGKEYFKESAAEVFEKFPEVESFSWTQYTPFFNDGDACTFSVHSDYFDVVLTNGEEWEEVCRYYEHDKDSRWYRPRERQDDLGDFLVDIVGAVDDDTMQEMFGDHVRVIVSRSGIEVDDYDHD